MTLNISQGSPDNRTKRMCAERDICHKDLSHLIMKAAGPKSVQDGPVDCRPRRPICIPNLKAVCNFGKTRRKINGIKLMKQTKVRALSNSPVAVYQGPL